MTIINEITKAQFNAIRNFLRTQISEKTGYTETACLQIYNDLLNKENSHELKKSHHDTWNFDRIKQRILKEIEELLEKTKNEESQDD